jgi:phosphatidylglycerophosphatase A
MDSFAVTVATVAGVGYAPFASGTVGSLVALPLVPAVAVLRGASAIGALIAVAGLVWLAVWAAGRAERVLGGADHGAIVVDEVAGMAVGALFVPGTWTAAVLMFVVFRAFDVLKPPPAGFFDKRVEGGLGVVGDDVIAGAYAGVVSALILGFLA